AILHVVLDGQMTEGSHASLSDVFSSATSMDLQHLTLALRSVTKDERIEGVVLEIRQPQMGYAQLMQMTRAIRNVRESGKRVVAYIDSASEIIGGNMVYTLATSANDVVISPPGGLYISGLASQVPFVKGLLDKLDVDVFVAKRHAYKTAPNMFTENKFT